jgi:hypothetical protein
MTTGASTAELAIILLDASRGITTQSLRHAYITSLLGIPHFVIAVNKMDLVSCDQEVFHRIRGEFAPFLTRLGVDDAYFLPLSALKGDNVVDRSKNMPWFDGISLLNTWRRSRRLRPRWKRRFGWRCSGWSARITPSAVTPDRLHRAWCGRGMRSWRCPPAVAHVLSAS